MKKILVPILIPVATLPLATTLACATNADPDQISLPVIIQNAIKALNTTPPTWDPSTNDGQFSESELDFLSQVENKGRWIEKLSFERQPNLDYQIKPNDLAISQGSDGTNGHINFQITISDPETNIQAKTNQFRLPYRKIPFQSQLLSAQKAKYNTNDLGAQFILKSDLPVFDPSTTAFYKASATHPQVDFETWKTTVYQKFIETVTGLKVQVLDFAIVPYSANPQIKQVALTFRYDDPITKESWQPPTIMSGSVHQVADVVLPVNLMIWQLLYQNKLWTLNPNHETNLDQSNFLANTNFDQLKDHWMVSTGINYHLIDFQNHQNTISFKLQVGDDQANQSPPLTFEI